MTDQIVAVGSTVLIAEDSMPVANLLAEILEGGGYQVVLTDSGEHALEVLRTRPVDVLLTDMYLAAEMNGFQLIERCRECYPVLKCILMSGMFDSTHRVNLPFPVIGKPVKANDLLQCIRGALLAAH